ncbi:hypothetical protein Dda_4455 [Drechslerella dactyloides]|uniref:Uncharacterized protein n=1 Tax=Drechslerella dactyloides TaxID=74499 RepID=A0AAD6NHY5_DREDA|nr:hypothetical protein Dda_4455 [Drechslerella dactyloides]
MKSIALAGVLPLLFQAASALPHTGNGLETRSLVARDQVSDNNAAFAQFTLDIDTTTASAVNAADRIAVIVALGDSDIKACAANCNENAACKYFVFTSQRYTSGSDTTSTYYRCSLYSRVLSLLDFTYNTATSNPVALHSVGYRRASDFAVSIPGWTWTCYNDAIIRNPSTWLGNRVANSYDECVRKADEYTKYNLAHPTAGSSQTCNFVNFYKLYQYNTATHAVEFKYNVCALYKMELDSTFTTTENQQTWVKGQSCVYALHPPLGDATGKVTVVAPPPP